MELTPKSTKVTRDKSKLGWVLFCAVMVGAWLNGIYGIQGNAATTTWDIISPDNYEVDQNNITIDDSGAVLKQIDQIDDDSGPAGFGGGSHLNTAWNASNGALELDAAGKASGSSFLSGTGTFTSRIIDATVPVSWASLTPLPYAPYLKQLPDNQGIETAYPSDNADMTGNVLLLHLNEASGATSFSDTSGNGNSGVCIAAGSCPTSGSTSPVIGGSSKLGTAVNFDGNDHIEIGTASNLEMTQNLTIETWVKPGDTLNYRTIIAKSGSYYLALTGLKPSFWLSGTKPAVWMFSATKLPNVLWSHVAVTYNGTQAKFYINGVLDRTVNGITGSLSSGAGQPVWVGWRSDTALSSPNAYTFKGSLDELAVYNRTLTDSEIAAHYRRGALSLKFQVRSCDDSACDGESFIGPGGSPTAYYSDYDNTATGTPVFALDSIASNRYFQYTATPGTNNPNLTPKITSVNIEPVHYVANSPIIRPAITNGVDFTSILRGFTANETGSVYYQVTNEGKKISPTWFYWDGSTWASALSESQYNTSSTISANINSFTEKVGIGNFSWRAFFASANGLVKTTLSKVYLNYNNPPLAAASLQIGAVGFQSGTSDLVDATSTAIHFSGVYEDSDDEDRAVKAQIQISTNKNFTDIDIWDSGSSGTDITPLKPGERTVDIEFGSFGDAPLQQLSLDDGNKNYYWRIKFWDASEGTFSESGSFTIMDAPVAPASVAAARISDTLFKIDWQDISTNVDSYLIERNADIGGGYEGWQEIGEVAADKNTYSDNSTVSNARYQYRVKAKNIAGISAAGIDNITHYTTPDAPTNVTAKYVSDGSFNVSYVPQANVEPSHKIERCSNEGCASETYVQIEGSPFTSSPQADNGVLTNSRYRYRVRAGLDETVTSSYSYSGYEYTTPLAPTGLVAKYNADNDITLTWGYASAYESGFKVYVSIDGGDYATGTIGRVENTYSYKEGTPGHNYKFKVAAYIEATDSNGELLSASSNESETIYSAPSAPTMGMPELISAESIKWNFVDNASTEEGFKLYTSTGTLIDTLGVVDAASFVENNLIPNTEYSRVIKAYSGSTESASSAITTTLTWAATPANFRAESTGRTYINLAWDGKNPDYTEYYFEDVERGVKYEWKTADLFKKQTGLACDINYTYKIKARNINGIETEEVSNTFKTLGCQEPVSVPTVPSASGDGSGTPAYNESDSTGSTSTLDVKLPAPTLTKPIELEKIVTLPFMIEGQAEPDNEVKVAVAGTAYEIKASVDGLFSVNVIDQLSDGEYIIVASQRNPGGEYGETATRKIVVSAAKMTIVDSLPLEAISTSTLISTPGTIMSLEEKIAEKKPVLIKTAIKKPLPPIIGAGGQVIKRRVPPVVVAPTSSIAVAPTLEKVQQILTEIKKKEAFLVILGKDIPQFQRRQIDTIETIPGEQLRLVVKPPMPVHSITARVYPAAGTALQAKSNPLSLKEKLLSWIGVETARAAEVRTDKWADAYVFETTDSSIYQGSIDLKNVLEGNYNLVVSLNGEDGSRTHISKKIEVVPNGRVLDNSMRPVGRARIIVYQQESSGHFVAWNADLYRSANPIFTNNKGEYALSLPPGRYYVQVDMPRHEFYQSGIFVFDKPGFITNNIVIAKMPTTVWYRFWDGVRDLFNKPVAV